MKGQIVSGEIKCENVPVAYASVYLSNSSLGTLSNGKGYYQLKISSPEDTLVFSCIGYEDLEIPCSNVIGNRLDVELMRSVEMVETVQITGDENFGKTVIKKAMENRLRHLNAVQTFSANVYLKGSLEEDGGNVIEGERSRLNFFENYSVVYFHQPHLWKVVNLGVTDLSTTRQQKFSLQQAMGGPPSLIPRNAPVNSELFFTNLSDGDFNFYQNTLSIPKLGETPFISPIGALALVSYDYEYLGSLYENDSLIHKIKVTPKRSADALFSGTIFIYAKNWSISAIELSLPKIALHYFESFKIYQKYEWKDSISQLSRQEFFYQSKKGWKSYHGSVYSEFSNYQFNIEHPKNTFSNAIRITTDSAFVRDSSYWQEVRSIPLKDNEKEFIEVMDSIETYEQSDEYLDFEERLMNKVTFGNVAFDGIDHYNRKKRRKWIIDPLMKQMKFAGVGGYRHALGGTFEQTFQNENKLDLYGRGDYGFGNQDFLMNGQVEYTYLPKKFARFRIAGGAKYQLLTYMQNFSALLSRSNFVRNDFLEIAHQHEVFNGCYLEVRLKYMQRSSLEHLSIEGWSNELFGEDNIPISFDPYNEMNLRITVSYTPFQKYALEPKKKIVLGSKWPTFTLRWQQGIPTIFDAKIDFQMVRLRIDQTFKLSVFGTGKYSIMAGKFLSAKEVEYPNLTFFRGTDNYFFSHPIYTFQLLGETHSSLNEYVEGHYIHHFNGMFIKKVPYLNRTKLESVAGAGILYLKDGNFKHSEVFAGLEFPLKFFGTKFKLGAYYAVAYSNYSNLNNMFKFGINVFNPFTNQWIY